MRNSWTPPPTLLLSPKLPELSLSNRTRTRARAHTSLSSFNHSTKGDRPSTVRYSSNCLGVAQSWNKCSLKLHEDNKEFPQPITARFALRRLRGLALRAHPSLSRCLPSAITAPAHSGRRDVANRQTVMSHCNNHSDLHRIS